MTFFFAPLVPKSYDAIIIDPPTEHKGFTPFEGEKGAPYMTMDDDWVRKLPVKNLARFDCLVMLWTTMPKLSFSMKLLEQHWGCTYVTAGSWFKRSKSGLISYGTFKVVSSGAECFLFGRYGHPNYVNKPFKGVFESDDAYDLRYDQLLDAAVTAHDLEAINALKRQHSRKPDEQYARIRQLMGPAARICDIFGRTDAPDIESWGDQTGTFKMGDGNA